MGILAILHHNRSVVCCLFSVFCLCFHVNMSICTTALYNGYVHNGIADSEVRLHQAATAGLQQHQDLKQGFLSEPMSGMLLLCWCWCGVVCFEELQIHPKVKVSCTTNKYTIQYVFLLHCVGRLESRHCVKILPHLNQKLRTMLKNTVKGSNCEQLCSMQAIMY